MSNIKFLNNVDVTGGLNTSGSVGVGTGSPSRKIHSLGLIRASRADSASQYVEIGSTSGADTSLRMVSPQSNVKASYIESLLSSYTAGSPSNKIHFRVGNINAPTTAMTITHEGRLGIGTTNPNAKLDVEGKVYLQDDGTIKWGSAANAGHLTWNTGFAIVKGLSGQALYLGADNDSDKMVIATSGNVGIGTTSPSVELEVSGDIMADAFEVNGGSSAEFLKADGSVDANTYASSAALDSYLPLAGGTLTGTLNGAAGTFSGALTAQGNLVVNSSSGIISSGWVHLHRFGSGTNVAVGSNGSNVNFIVPNGNVGIGTLSPNSLLELSKSTGAVLTLTRDDNTAVDGDTIGKIDFRSNDGSSPLPGIVGSIESVNEGGSGLDRKSIV